MQTEKRIGANGFKFMLEFPNKVRVYITDEQTLSRILEKSGISSEVKTSPIVGSQSQSREKGELIQSQLELQSHDNANTLSVSNCEIRESECENSDSQKIDHSKELDAPGLSGYSISEDETGFTIKRRSKRGFVYTNRIYGSIVEDVYGFLKNNGGQFSVYEIEKRLNIAHAYIYHALQVLQSQRKVLCEQTTEPGKNCFLYKAI